jgi:diamine N-acetyltransferase
MKNKINLRAITSENYREIIRLKVSSEQEHLVASNLYTIAQMQFKPEKIALGIYNGDKAVGLIAYDLDDYDIWRLMIDHGSQGCGFGTQAMYRVIEIFRQHGKLSEIRTSAILGKNSPKAFYEKIGFRENGQVIELSEDGSPLEIVLVYSI